MTARTQRLSPMKVLLFGVAGLAIGELIKLWQDTNPLLSSALAVVAGSIPLIIDFLKQSAAQPEGVGRATRDFPPYQHPAYQRYAPPPRVAHRPVVGSLVVGLVVLLLVGGGIAYAISYGVGWAIDQQQLSTGNEDVIADRLEAPASGRAGQLSVTVNKVEITANFTKVTVTAVNQSRVSIGLPAFGFCQLIDTGGATQKATVTGSGDGSIDVPPGGVQVSTVITFDGNPPATRTTMTLSFSALFPHGPGFTADSLQVKGIKLKPAV